jgi:hypothetical protein
MGRPVTRAGPHNEKPPHGLAPGGGSGQVKNALDKRDQHTRPRRHFTSRIPIWSDDRAFQGWEVLNG